MRIAVVGAGISGLAAAYLLRHAHEVSLFESNAYLGGHSNTITVRNADGPVHLDTGFIVYNEDTYPGFTRLLRDLGVATQPSDMSFSVQCRRCDLEYSSRGLRGMLAQARNGFSPWRVRMGLEILRFYRHAQQALLDGSVGQTALAEFLDRGRYSLAMRRHFVVPLAACLWSTPPSGIAEFPAEYFLKFLRRHKMLGNGPALNWRTVTSGSQAYVRRIAATLNGGVHPAAPVCRVERNLDGVTLRFDDGDATRFDKVVLACHADEAIRLLDRPTDDEVASVGSIKYTPNPVVLHTDPSLMPEKPIAWASWNYHVADCRDDAAPLSMTYHLNRLQAIGGATQYFVSVNTGERIAGDAALRRMDYSHPVYNFATVRAQAAIRRLNGEGHTYYAGAYLGYGFHEDGFASGAAVAEALLAAPRVTLADETERIAA